MSIDSTWLRCPNCFLDLEAVSDRVIGCGQGHRFDLTKHGAVTLLPPKAPRTIGDDRAMLDARRELLDSGAYRPVTDAIVDAARAALASTSSDGTPHLVDLGCGTGHYARAIHDQTPSVRVLLADRSPDAVRVSLRALPEATGVVLDLWRPLPLRDGVAEVAINVFAPRNPPEFARILRPSGRLLVVVPTARHLIELRRLGRTLDVPPDKAELVTAQLGTAGFGLEGRHAVEYHLDADAPTRDRLVGMGPSAHHDATRTEPDAAIAAALEVTVSVDVMTFALV